MPRLEKRGDNLGVARRTGIRPQILHCQIRTDVRWTAVVIQTPPQGQDREESQENPDTRLVPTVCAPHPTLLLGAGKTEIFLNPKSLKVNRAIIFHGGIIPSIMDFMQ
jgi:hypothetical protein